MQVFRWIEWNLDKIAKHGVSVEEVERVVRNAGRPFPMRRDNDKWLVIGRGQGTDLLKFFTSLTPIARFS